MTEQYKLACVWAVTFDKTHSLWRVARQEAVNEDDVENLHRLIIHGVVQQGAHGWEITPQGFLLLGMDELIRESGVHPAMDDIRKAARRVQDDGPRPA